MQAVNEVTWLVTVAMYSVYSRITNWFSGNHISGIPSLLRPNQELQSHHGATYTNPTTALAPPLRTRQWLAGWIVNG